MSVVNGVDMIFKIIVANAALINVRAIAARVLAAFNAAFAAKVFARCLAAHTLLNIAEAVAAIRAKMLLVVGILHAHTERAIALCDAAFQTETAEVALLHRAKRCAAVFADMVKPIAVFYAVFAAFATLALGVFKAAVGAEPANIAEFQTFVIKASVALLANLTFVGAVAPCVCDFAGVGFTLKAVIANRTVRIMNKLNAVLAVAAAVADILAVAANIAAFAHLVFIAVKALKTVQAVVVAADGASLAPAAFAAENAFVCKTAAAVRTVSILVAIAVHRFFGAQAAVVAAPVAPVVATANCANLAVPDLFRIRKRLKRL